jgi:hypothetical protein
MPLSDEPGTSNDVRFEHNGVVESDNSEPDLSLMTVDELLLLLDDSDEDQGKGKKNLIDGFTGATGEEIHSSPIVQELFNLCNESKAHCYARPQCSFAWLTQNLHIAPKL